MPLRLSVAVLLKVPVKLPFANACFWPAPTEDPDAR